VWKHQNFLICEETMRKLFLILVAAVLFGCLAAESAASPNTGKPGPDVSKASVSITKGLTKEQRDKNLESFEMVWKTILDSHYDPKLGGLDWQAVHKELKPRIEKADSMSDARNVMRDMLNRLGHSHVAIVPASL